jgi:hypothetical protein
MDYTQTVLWEAESLTGLRVVTYHGSSTDSYHFLTKEDKRVAIAENLREVRLFTQGVYYGLGQVPHGLEN